MGETVSLDDKIGGKNKEDDLRVLHDGFSSHPTSLYKLCPPEDSPSIINLICKWQTSKKIAKANFKQDIEICSSSDDDAKDDCTICGEHHILGLDVRPAALYNDHITNVFIYCPITIGCNQPSYFPHDFDQGPAVIRFDISLCNRLKSDTLSPRCRN